MDGVCIGCFGTCWILFPVPSMSSDNGLSPTWTRHPSRSDVKPQVSQLLVHFKLDVQPLRATHREPRAPSLSSQKKKRKDPRKRLRACVFAPSDRVTAGPGTARRTTRLDERVDVLIWRISTAEHERKGDASHPLFGGSSRCGGSKGVNTLWLKRNNRPKEQSCLSFSLPFDR